MVYKMCIFLALWVGSCSAMDKEPVVAKASKSLSQQIDKNHNKALACCVTGVLSALSALRLSDNRNKRLYYGLVLSTVCSICAMLKYANNNKKLLEQ